MRDCFDFFVGSGFDFLRGDDFLGDERIAEMVFFVVHCFFGGVKRRGNEEGEDSLGVGRGGEGSLEVDKEGEEGRSGGEVKVEDWGVGCLEGMFEKVEDFETWEE